MVAPNFKTLSSSLINQWHPTKNGLLTPKDVTPGVAKKVWWLCKNQHSWIAAVGSRTSGSGCPYCSGQIPTEGTCLGDKNPKLAKQWHPKKNGLLTPQDFTSGSGKKVWWICKNGHEWVASISNRNKGKGCATCSEEVRGDRARKYTIQDLKEFAEDKGGRCLSELYSSSKQKIKWECNSKHLIFEATWMHVKWQNTWCPYCAGRGKTIEDMKALAKARGGECLSLEYQGVFTKLKWKCRENHEWPAIPDSIQRGSWCPICIIYRGEEVCRSFSLLLMIQH